MFAIVPGQPESDVIAVGVKILRSMAQPPERLPGRLWFTLSQGRLNYSVLRFNISISLGKCTAVVMEMIMPHLVAKRILPDIGGDDRLQCAPADLAFDRLLRNLTVVNDFYRASFPGSIEMERL